MKRVTILQVMQEAEDDCGFYEQSYSWLEVERFSKDAYRLKSEITEEITGGELIGYSNRNYATAMLERFFKSFNEVVFYIISQYHDRQDCCLLTERLQVQRARQVYLLDKVRSEGIE